MKKLLCLLLTLLLCVTLLGCDKDNTTETDPSLSIDETNTVSVEEIDYVYGRIVEKIPPNILVLKLDTLKLVESFGERVYIITDEYDEWRVGNEIEVKISEIEKPLDTTQCVRIKPDTINQYYSDYKPIIYFYPEAPTVCSAKIILNSELACTYPAHNADGWENFTAYPDGTLVFPDGKEYYALYWEGIHLTEWDFSKGFCVKGEDTAAFLEWALAEQGLTSREANEFIIYWLPLMQNNPYNVIAFQTTAYTDGAVLDISPSPDSLLRVFMAYYPTENEMEIQPQIFDKFVRNGFTVVEWGGSQVSEP